MSRFRTTDRDVPSLNLAALPDLIFTVLFFFMIVTHMRQVDPKVAYRLPQGTEVGKAQRRAGLVYILIGEEMTSEERGERRDGGKRIQVNDRLVALDDIPAAIAEERAKMGDGDGRRLTVCIRADRDTEMGLVNDVKQRLRQSGVLNVNYAARKAARK